ADEDDSPRTNPPRADQPGGVPTAFGVGPDECAPRVDPGVVDGERPDVFDVVHLGLNRDGLPHVSINTGVQIVLGPFELITTFRAGRHGHLVATDAPIVIADDSNAGSHDVLGQVAIDQIALGSRSAHVAVTVHEPAPRHHQDGRVTSGTVTGR